MNMAFRAILWAIPGEVVVTAQAYDLLREAADFKPRMRPLGKFPIKYGLFLTLYALEPAADPLAHLYGEEIAKEIPLATKLQDAARGRRNLDPASKERIADRLIELKKEAVYGLVALVVAVTAHLAFENSPPFRMANVKGYQTLQTFMTSPEGRPPVTVIDIGNALDDPSHATRIDKLAELMIATAKFRPKAIALDIDMGADEKSHLFHDSNRVIRNLALDITKTDGVPVYLAVDRFLVLGKDDALGSPIYANLIVSPHIPNDVGVGEILLGKRVHLLNTGESFTTLSYALAKSFGEKQTPAWWPVNPAISLGDYQSKSTEEAGKNGTAQADPDAIDAMFGGRYPINYGGLEKIKSDCTIHLHSSTISLSTNQQARDVIPGSMVIIGSDTSKINAKVDPKDLDQWHLPNGKLLAGVYYHALGAWTLSSAPVYMFTGAAALAIVLISGLGLYVIPLTMKWRRIADKQFKDPSEFVFALAMVPVVVLFAILCMRLYSVMFTGYVSLAILTVLHPAVGRLVRSVIRRVQIGWQAREAYLKLKRVAL
jgi:hypothetical protein